MSDSSLDWHSILDHVQHGWTKDMVLKGSAVQIGRAHV